MALGAFDEIIGKTIAHVVFKENPYPPRQQALVFDDGTQFEIYGGDGEPMGGCKGLDKGGLDAALRSGSQRGQRIHQVPLPGTGSDGA